MIRFPKLSTVLVILTLGLSGCPKVYFWTVTTPISPHSADALRAVVRKLPGLEGPKRITGGDPNCSYYDKRLPESGALLAFSECYLPSKDSATGWNYRVTVNTFEGGRPEVEKEIGMLIEEIRRIIETQIPNAKPKVETDRVLFW
jgi:hypothetical protein